MINSINKKHQALVNRFAKWSTKYDLLLDANDGEETRACENAYNKAAEIWVELPKREQANLAKQLPNVKGCY